MSALQAWEDQGIAELYYFDESGFSQSSALPYAWSPVGKPLEMTAYESFATLRSEAERILSGYGTECAISFA
jgi:hypothetical protein